VNRIDTNGSFSALSSQRLNECDDRHSNRHTVIDTAISHM